MGLDFSHGDAHWTYGGFSRFRTSMAKHEGFDLNIMDGYGAPESWSDSSWRGRPWDNIDTPLKPLLNHSDCDGELTPEECRTVAPRLREVVQAIWGDSERSNDYRSGIKLADAMDHAAETGEPLEFI